MQLDHFLDNAAIVRPDKVTFQEFFDGGTTRLLPRDEEGAEEFHGGSTIGPRRPNTPQGLDQRSKIKDGAQERLRCRIIQKEVRSCRWYPQALFCNNVSPPHHSGTVSAPLSSGGPKWWKNFPEEFDHPVNLNHLQFLYRW